MTTKDSFAGPAGFAPEVYQAYNTIVSLARTINLPVQAPEVVFVGKRGCGKSVMIESFLGHRFFDISPTLRPVEIRMINNPECEVPLVTFHRDPAIPDLAANDVDVPISKTSEALKQRNIKTAVPIVCTYQFKFTWNLTVIDTPGLLGRNDDRAEMEAAEDLAIQLCRPSQRIVVVVSEVGEWGSAVESVDWAASKFDARRERTVFVFNKFHPFIKNFTSSAELRTFFSSTPLGGYSRVFFTTSPGDSGRPDNAVLYKRRLQALLKADLEALEALQYDKRLEKNVGAAALQRCLLEMSWKKYQPLTSEVMRRLRELGRQAVEGKARAEKALASLSVGELRSSASLQVSALLRAVGGLVLGSLDGRPAQYGQTLTEEKAVSTEQGEWVDSRREKIPIDISSVPGFDSKLYGGQQFERVLAEFKTVAKSVKPDFGADEIASALGVGRSDVSPNIAWAASDLAQTKSQQALATLVVQLVERLKYVLKRTFDVAELVTARNAAAQQRLQKEDLAAPGPATPSTTSPYFSAYAKDLFIKYVDEIADKTLSKCTEEFYGTKLVYWDLNSTQVELLERFRTSGCPVDEAVRALADNLFESIKQRVVTDVLLKCYEGMLVPIAQGGKASQVIQGTIAMLGESELEELFELDITRDALAAEKSQWEQIQAKFQEQESAFLKASASFSHPIC